MIEKYYAAHIKTQLDAAAINIMRPIRRSSDASCVWADFRDDHNLVMVYAHRTGRANMDG